MNTISKAMLLGMLLLAMAAPSVNATTLFFDDFNAGASAAWGNNYGNWTASGGVYDAQLPSSAPSARSLVTGLTLTDFAVDVDVQAGIDGGFWLRATDTGIGIGALGVMLVWAGGSIYWHVVTSPDDWGAAINPAPNPFYGGNFSVHATVQGNVFSAFINGSAIPITVLIDNTYTSGLAGLYDFADPQTFDNFRISSSEVPLPAALPLFASGIGVMGLLAWRRKRKSGPGMPGDRRYGF